MNLIAQSLWQARLNREPIAPLTETHPDLTLEAAYEVSRELFQKRILEPGVRSVGRKIGLTSLAVQKQLGVLEPDFGYLTSDMMIPGEGVLPAGGLIQGRIEGEVAFVLGKDLMGPEVTFGKVMAATDYVVACAEVIDSRVADWKIKIQDTIADNASSAFFVMSDQKKKLSDIDLRMAGMTLRKNGEVESTGVGAACMDHPILAVIWLANRLAAFGEGLKAGDIILSGAYGPVVPMALGDHFEIAISGLGSVRCRYGN